MIQRSCISGKWEKELSQINRTLLLRWVPNLFFITDLYHRDDKDVFGCSKVELWVKLCVSESLIQTFFGLLDGHKRITASIEKHQLGAKATKMGTPPLIIAV